MMDRTTIGRQLVLLGTLLCGCGAAERDPSGIAGQNGTGVAGNENTMSGGNASGDNAGASAVPDAGMGGTAGGAGGSGPPTGGTAGAPSALGGGGSGGSGGAEAEACPELPALSISSGALLELSTELTLGGQPIEFGEPTPLEGNQTLTPIELRFYVSEVALIRPDETRVDVSLVTDAAEPAPYGVHLVNADNQESLRIRMLAPAGSYAGISFTLGLNDACNSGSSGRKMPLGAASAMTWPPPFGYLFLRYTGMVNAAETGRAAPPQETEDTNTPRAIHMGGLPTLLFAPRVEARGNITVDASGSTAMRLAFHFDELFRAANTPMDLSDYPAPSHPEVLLGEKVRRLAPELSLFTLLPKGS